MIRVTTFLLAEAAFVSETQRLFVHGGGFVSHDVSQLPTALPQLAVAVRLQATLEEFEGDHVLELDFIGPSGSSIVGSPAELPLPPVPDQELPLGNVATLQLGVTVSPFPINEAGLYTATLAIGGEHLAEEPFVVRVHPPS